MRPGDVLRGKYRVVRVLGEGGMGIVVRATHLRLDRDVAIKMLKGDASENARLVARFAREARAAARLSGDHAVRILDVDDEGPEPFLVMEYLEGKDLDRLVRKEGPLETKRAVQYVLEACEGLAEAHALGIVHRDVKPANLFLASTPRGGEIVKLLDFGISKPAAGDDPTLTEGDRILGSPSFMSPEQLKAAREVDARTDVWALGVVLYFLLSAKLPFSGENATAVAAMIASEQPPALDSPLMPIIARCLEKDREKRYATVADLAHALAPFADAGEEAARRVSSVLRLPVAPAVSAPSSSMMQVATNQTTGRQTASLSDVEKANERLTASVDAPAPLTSTSPGEKKIATVPPPPARARWPIAIGVAALGALVAFTLTRREPEKPPTTPTTPMTPATSAPPVTASVPTPVPSEVASAPPVVASFGPTAKPVVKPPLTPPPKKDAGPPTKVDDPLKLDIK